MPLEAEVYLQDVRVSCGAIAEYVAGKTLDDHQKSRMLRSTAERELGMVGEAVNQLLKLEPAIEQRLSDARRIVGFRNILIHNYARVRADRVWEIAVECVPTLTQRFWPNNTIAPRKARPSRYV